MITLMRTSGIDENFISLIKLLDSDLNVRYGQLQQQYDKHNIIESNNTVVVAFFDDKPAGCGCFKKYDDLTVEIKRMFVKPEFRGKGIAKSILDELEKWATETNFKSAVLETGIRQFEAINLYKKLGYVQIENFGQYIGNSNSICMNKKLKQ